MAQSRAQHCTSEGFLVAEFKSCPVTNITKEETAYRPQRLHDELKWSKLPRPFRYTAEGALITLGATSSSHIEQSAVCWHPHGVALIYVY